MKSREKFNLKSTFKNKDDFKIIRDNLKETVLNFTKKQL
jgi:hypothetical protein